MRKILQKRAEQSFTCAMPSAAKAYAKIIMMLTAMLTIGMVANAQDINAGGRHRGGAAVDKSGDKVLQGLIKTEVPKFRQLKYYDSVTGDTIDYNLFVPKDYDPSKKYPLLLYMADASTINKEVTAPLTQGYGALEFVIDSDQAKHPSFVFVPQFQDKVVVNDTFYVSPHVGSIVRLLGDLQKQYSIDTDRLYTTGQSMGGMISFYLNITYPDLFAASLFVGSQWDTSKMASFAGKKFFYIVAGGDEKAPKGMAALAKVLDQNEADYATAEWSAKLPDSEQEANVRNLLAKGDDINFITFTTGSVLPESGQGNEHMASFDYAYKLSEVRDWLFRQTKEHRSDSILSILKNPASTQVLVNANKGDWHGTTANSIHAIDKAIHKGAAIATIYLTRDSVGNVIADAHPIKEAHHAEIADRNLHLTLTDILSYAKGKILIEFANAAEYRNEILVAVKATGTENIVILGGVDNDDNLMFIPKVNLDDKNAFSNLQKIVNNHPVAIELSFSNGKNLAKAFSIIKGKTRILINTSSDGQFGDYKDVSMHDNVNKAWSEPISLGATIIQSDQIKPLLKWLAENK